MNWARLLKRLSLKRGVSESLRLVSVMPKIELSSVLASPKVVLAVRDLNECSLMNSASGGAFMILAREIVKNGGVVFGAACSENYSVKHIGVSREEDLGKLQGSKYVFSDVGDTFRECLNLICADTPVLYSGTPCQIVSLRSFLNRANIDDAALSKLLCVDLICHGAPKQEIYSAYLKWLEKTKRADSGSVHFQFRSKQIGWGSYCYCISYTRRGKKHQQIGRASDDPYYYAFSRGVINKKSCYACPYASVRRAGDFTIGDYWGIESIHPEFYSSKGVSAVMLNTDAAIEFFEIRCKQSCAWIETALDELIAHNENLSTPTARSDKDVAVYNELERLIAKGCFDEAFNGLLHPAKSIGARVRSVLPMRIATAIMSKGRR